MSYLGLRIILSLRIELTLRSSSCGTRTYPRLCLKLSHKDFHPCGTPALVRGRRKCRQCCRSSKCGCLRVGTAPMDAESTGCRFRLRSRCNCPCRCTDKLWHFRSKPLPSSAVPSGSHHRCIWELRGRGINSLQKKEAYKPLSQVGSQQDLKSSTGLPSSLV